MDVNDLKGLYAEANKRMAVVLERVKHELAGVRTGRASVSILAAESRGNRRAVVVGLRSPVSGGTKGYNLCS